MRRSGLWLAVLIAWPALAQLPASFRAEVARIEALFISAPDKAAVTYLMARTWASAQQWHEAMAWLEKAVDLNAGFDPSRDTLFAGLRDDPGFQKIVAQVRDSTPPIGHSSVAYTVAEGDLVPEYGLPREDPFVFLWQHEQAESCPVPHGGDMRDLR